jgi:hypothetical protein
VARGGIGTLHCGPPSSTKLQNFRGVAYLRVMRGKVVALGGFRSGTSVAGATGMKACKVCQLARIATVLVPP